MSIFGRKPKTYGEMVADPAFVYQIGRLVGSAEMASNLLSDSSDPHSQSIGAYLSDTVSWFFRADSNLTTRPSSEPTTLVRPPRPSDTVKPS